MHHSISRLGRRPLFVLSLLVLTIPSLAQAYGGDVHRMVNRSALLHLPANFQGFSQWATDLENLATDADERKCCVPGESIKHYIDIDDYPEFFAGTLPQTYSAMVADYGQSRVDGNGTVPWSIEASYQALVTAFTNEDWTTAVAVAADIGHYVADSHNPMHLTVNYNGQLTGQYGIHSRHESQMTSRHLAELEPAAGTAILVPDVLGSVFDWIDEIYPGVQMILDADLTAEAAAGGSTSSNTYYDTLWQEVGPETKGWLQSASVRIASLWYSAWVEAGSPLLPGDSTAAEPTPHLGVTQVLANVPNPFNPFTRLRYYLANDGQATLQIFDSAGRSVRTVDLAGIGAGEHEFGWNGTDTSGHRVASGVYRIVVTDGEGTTATGRAVLVK